MIKEKSASSTEDFFDLYERNPHAIKILFHSMQAGVIHFFGYSLKNMRILSLISAFLSLFLMYRLIEKTLSDPNRKTIAMVVTILMSLDVQFIYISHFARQEIQLILLLLIMMNLLLSTKMKPLVRGTVTGVLLGLGAGIHPNIFIIAWPVGLILLMEILQKKRNRGEGLIFLAAAIIVTSIFVLISFKFNHNFIRDYRAYGEPLGVLNSPDLKLLKLPGFYKKLFLGIRGTYYTPDIRLQMIFFPLLLAAVVIKKKKIFSLCGFAGFNIGLVIIGKYSQPSIAFLLPFYYLLWAELLEFKWIHFLIPLLSAATLTITLLEINRETEKFSDYTEQLNTLIPSRSTALGNLYSEYAMADGNFFDWRNLSYLKEKNISLADYITTRGIEYIIISEELSFIYENRPYWNVIYGNVAHWYPGIINFISEECILIGEFESPGYGMRISAYRYEKPWYVRVYKVSKSE